MDTKRKKVLVAGTGISGAAAAELLLEQGRDILLYDGNEKLCESDIRARSERFSDIPIILGRLKDEDIEQVSMAVFSPGIPLDQGLAVQLRAHGIEIWGEIELAYRCAKGKLAAITGTNGKTTTTALAGEILKSVYPDVKVVGNIGIPYTSLAARMTEQTVTAAEISSFQLETVHEFCPDVSAVLNITPDHLNRHHTMECYAAVKESIAKNQKPGQACVLNYEDERLRSFGKTLMERSIQVIYFSSKRKLERGLYFSDGALYLSGSVADAFAGKKAAAQDAPVLEGGIRKLIDVRDLKLPGVHNYENVMAAAAVSLACGVPLEKITGVLKTFQGVEHRIEYTAQIAGVRYYNDSKATNPDAAVQGIRAMDRPTYLIGGGYDKQSEYGEWIAAFGGRVKKLVLVGETKEKIAQAAAEQGFLDTVLCDSFSEAVAYCHDHAAPGEAVLLSPACASWDMFQSYEERGRVFKDIVHGYEAARPQAE